MNNCKVTANEIAHQLLLNGKVKKNENNKSNNEKLKIERDPENENKFLESPFTIEEISDAIKSLKYNKAPGLDDLRVEQLKHFGTDTLKWLLKLMNSCINTCHIPKIWRKARVIALLKPGKEPSEPKNFRPVSLLCHLYKVLEKMILNRIGTFVDTRLIAEQAGFRPGKSCSSQVLNLTQYIEDGYESKLITGMAFIDLSAAYDTINHKKLTYKVYELTKDFSLTKFIECSLQNRRFFVNLQNKTSRWRKQKNGLAQGSVLAPLLFNIYVNDQSIDANTRHFIYADDTAVGAQGKTFEEIETKITVALEKLAIFYDRNNLKANPSKSQICTFHLNNSQAQKCLDITWRGEKLQHCNTPKYLGVKLDRTLSFNQHCSDTKKKVIARNNIIRKLAHSTWGAHPHTLRTSALALSISAAEYAAPVWRNSTHAKQVDVAVNDTLRVITGCLRPTPVNKLYPIASIAPPNIRRQVAAEVEKFKQEVDNRHPLFEHHPPPPRLKSRKSFIRSTIPCTQNAGQRRLELWTQCMPTPVVEIRENLSVVPTLKFQTWKALKRLRVGVTKCNANMVRWGFAEDNKCECGLVQDEDHLLICRKLPSRCSLQDLAEGNQSAILVAQHWELCI